MKKWEPRFNLGVVEAQRRTHEEPADLLNTLKNLWHDHLQPSGTEIAFILLDDLHYFPIRAEESAYLTLRTTFQELVNQKCNYSLVVTAHSALFTEIADLAEPLLRFFKRFDLKQFTFDEAKEAVTKRLAAVGGKFVLDDDVIEQVVEKTEGHPYLIMFVMYELLTKLRPVKGIGKNAFEKTWPHIEDSLGKTIFEQKVQSASEKERQLMTEIAKTSSKFVSPSEFKSANELFSRLERKELLLRHDRGKYYLFHPLFSEYLKRKWKY